MIADDATPLWSRAVTLGHGAAMLAADRIGEPGFAPALRLQRFAGTILGAALPPELAYAGRMLPPPDPDRSHQAGHRGEPSNDRVRRPFVAARAAEPCFGAPGIERRAPGDLHMPNERSRCGRPSPCHGRS